MIPNHLVVGSNPTAPANFAQLLFHFRKFNRHLAIFLAYRLDSIFLIILEKVNMSIIKSEDSSKWINALVALAALLSGFIVTKFVDQIGIWFDLEAKISSFPVASQAAGVIVGLLVFIITLKNKYTSTYLQDVYNELLKVVWPSKDQTVKMTIGLVIALIAVAGIFVFVDFVFKKILSFIY